jgi:hypothetical protein
VHVFGGFGRFVFLFIHERVEQEGAPLDGLGFGGGGGEWLHGAGLGVGGHFDYVEGGSEAERRGSSCVIEDFAQDGDRFFGEGGGLVMPEHGAFAGGEFEFAGEGGVGTSPGADGVAMDSGGGSGFGGGDAFSEQAENVVLRG